MPRRKFLRRFDPSYGLSMAAVEMEAKILEREVEWLEVLATSDVERKRDHVYEKSRHCWDHLCLLIDGLSDREQRTLHSLLFRDFYHILELYLCHLRMKHPGLSTPSPFPSKPKKPADSEFNEWLFSPQPKGDSDASSNV